MRHADSNPNPSPSPSPILALALAVTRTLTRSSTKEAAAALKSFANRKFDGRVVAVSHLPEADFHALKDGE